VDISVRTEGPWAAENRSWLASRDGTEVCRSITLDTSAFTAVTHYPNGYVPSGTVLSLLANGMYGPYAGNAAEAQTVTITGTPTGGTFTLTYRGDTTAAIAYNATAGAVQTALEALPSITPGDVTVTGGPGPGTPYVVTFAGTQTGDVPQMTSAGSFTGGSSPAVAVTTTTAGGAGGPGAHADGFLFSNVEMRSGGPDVGGALHWRGVIKVSNLPANSGLDAAARTQLTRFRFE
jgi:hypothetical protein